MKNNEQLQPAPPLVIEMVVDLEPGAKDWFISREAPDRGKVKVEISNTSPIKKYYKIHIEELDEAPDTSVTSN